MRRPLMSSTKPERMTGGRGMAGRVVIVFMGESFPVMAGLVPAIHVFVLPGCKDVDGRHKAGHDDNKILVIRRVGKGALCAVPTTPKLDLLAEGGHASLCPPYDSTCE